MKVLVVGSGGREHALVWKIARSSLVDKVFCAPGNAGISALAECIPVKAEDTARLLDFARKEKIDLTVIGPELPLSKGIVDEFHNRQLKVFGPTRKAAQLEASKVFAKELMRKYNIPTADFKVFDAPRAAYAYIEERGAPCVVKADGLAAGKGVIVAQTAEEAKQAVKLIMEEKAFGDAGNKVIIEECLQGQEASILVITDSKAVLPLASSQDHKRIFDNDAGPNTGGMGAYSPAPVVTESIFSEIMSKVIHKTIDGLAREGISYTGVLYAGVMLTSGGPKVLEFNVRFGDPETEAIIPRLKSDLLEVMLAATEGRLDRIAKGGGLSWENRSCVCVVLASGGYPGPYETGKEISGLDEAGALKDIVVFHAGTTKKASACLTAGGRVLAVCGLGNGIPDTIDKTYRAVEKIDFEGMHYRKDIAAKAI
ncbi:MAG: phosphoribosylamine--glycine ligase [Candidatus Omnitrophica bacterium]|nr:phosphoribosylamine--glycine ligase [Candidatus Omnitrophota bacterium]